MILKRVVLCVSLLVVYLFSLNKSKITNMKKLKLLFLFTLISFSLIAQKKPLDESIYDEWSTISKFLISDDANTSFTQYKNHIDKSILQIKIHDSGFNKIIKGASSPKFFHNQQLACFTAKDTIYIMDIANETIKVISDASTPNIHEEAKYITYFKDKTHYILDAESLFKEQSVIDSTLNVTKSSFLNPNNIMVITSDSITTSFVSIILDTSDLFIKNCIYSTQKIVKDFDFKEDGKSLIFFSAIDSAGIEGVEVELLERKKRRLKKVKQLYDHKITALNETLVPDGLKLNIKKGVSFSDDGSFYKFYISPLSELVNDKEKMDKTSKLNKKVKNPEFEYELWRWNDALLPIQNKDRNSIFINNILCTFRPKENKFIQLSYGRGIFLLPDDSSPYAFEFDNKPYFHEEHWKDPIPKDFYYTNVSTGVSKVLMKEFSETLVFSNNTPHLFTYENSSDNWYVTYLDSEKKVNLSKSVPYSFKKDDFDKPQPAGPYGSYGLSADNKFFIVYDKYDIWALPIDGDSKKAYCITNGYGRKNNIRFKILKLRKDAKKSSKSSDGVDLNEDFIVESLNLDNMHAGYYRVLKDKNPVKLIEGPYKFSTTKHLKNGSYVVKRESFNEAPDYWIANEDFELIRRVTSLNDNLQNYMTGDSKIISWNDKSGQEQTGVLYTPENYDPTQAYPTIVYFYETMSQDAFLFYDPAPSISEINPIMFVSRGYVVFMPDIRYEIGWPGKSCSNIVESGTRHLIDKGVIDPNKVGLQGHSWGGYQVAYLITQTDLFTAACSETAVVNMTSAYTGIRNGPGKSRMFMYESTQSRIGGTLWEKKKNYIENSPLFYLDQVTTPLLSRHSDGDEAVPFSQGIELFMGLKRLGKEVWMFNYKGDGHNIRKRSISLDWTKRMDEYFDYYLMDAPRPKWMIVE